MAEKKVNPSIEALIEHLRSTGTGGSKLVALRELGEKVGNDKDAFLIQATRVVPEGTMKKINDYVNGYVSKAAPAVKEQPAPAPEATPAPTGPVTEQVVESGTKELEY
jgi:hypothetical protein